MTPFNFRLEDLVNNHINVRKCFACLDNNEEELILYYAEAKSSKNTGLVWFHQSCFNKYYDKFNATEQCFALNIQDIFTLKLLLNA